MQCNLLHTHTHCGIIETRLMQQEGTDTQRCLKTIQLGKKCLKKKKKKKKRKTLRASEPQGPKRFSASSQCSRYLVEIGVIAILLVNEIKFSRYLLIMLIKIIRRSSVVYKTFLDSIERLM